jgi:hypothetical protein
MALPPIKYRATDYPPQYRPVGYWRHAGRRAEGSGDPPDPRRRGRWWALLAVLLATLVLHAGIAVAYLGDSGGTTTKSSAADPAQKGARCDAKGEPDPSVTVPPDDSQGSSDPGPGGPDTGGSGGTGDSSASSDGNSRGAL